MNTTTFTITFQSTGLEQREVQRIAETLFAEMKTTADDAAGMLDTDLVIWVREETTERD